MPAHRVPTPTRLGARSGPRASVQTLTVAAVAAWATTSRPEVSHRARTARLRRRHAACIGADPLVAHVRCSQVQHERPKALSDRELSQLLARPDLRATIGICDRAILELLARAGLRRSELEHLTLSDVQERGRQPKRAPPHSDRFWTWSPLSSLGPGGVIRTA
jgi:integrase